MHPLAKIAFSVIGLSVAGASVASAQERDRNKIPDRYKWDLTQLYPSNEAWKNEKEKTVARFPGIEKFMGTLGSSSGQLLGCLNLVTDISKEMARLYSYASMSSDQDTRESKYLALVQEMSQLWSDFSARASFIEPEILKIDRTTVDRFLKEERGLGIFRHYLDDILRRKQHTRTESEEKIIADAGLMADGPEGIYNIFSNADFPYPEVTFSDGRSVKLDKSAFGLHRAEPNREDRQKVFQAFFSRLHEYRRTFGTQLNAEVKKNLFYMRSRNYESCLQRALDANNIPVEVYRSLIENVNKNLPTFHRYLKLRQRILGLDELHYYDLYAPLLKDVDLKYPAEEAEKNILSSLEPLGKEYLQVGKRSFTERWIDMFPSDGKRSGAYSNGSAYDVHPYMLMNYNGKYDDMSTLTHELGHTMHSHFSNKTQPYATANYSIFVAEVASTFNEALLIDYMLKQIKDDDVRLSLLGNYLEGIKGTVFRQTQFAEFELRIHESAEKGEPLTGDVFDSLYFDITKRYYGHDQKICIVDDEMRSEWAYIPHFYYNFYVYQYATSFTASSALSEHVLAGDKTATKRYVEFLSAGGSDYPINLLKKAGVDMTTAEPFELTMKKMNRVMDEMEKILEKRGVKGKG
ncbi:MAG: oligoendopeptidase F [Ignavibacteriales bacterium]|nr:oligoendopeptidase F [Ignavibacteriales bacterium]